MKTRGDTLADVFPDIAMSWDNDRNGDLTPRDVAPYSKKQVWWKCKKCGESWQAKVASRTAGQTGCAYCAGKRVSASNSLVALYPDIAKQWDVEKNGALTPDQVLTKSSRRAWWICPEGHSYLAHISGRTRGRGCPICSGNVVIPATSLAAKFPDFVAQWHPNKNLPLTPTSIAPYSGSKVWWKCPSGHEWQATVANRTSAGSGCPYCGGQRVSPTNSLSAVNPQLAAEWHPTKNQGKLPGEYTALSGHKVWWRCPRGHEWAATINHRKNGSGCPFCGGGTSALEVRVFTELKMLFSDVIWHSNSMGVQVDVLLPTLHVGVELDGHYWHAEKIEADLRKNAICEKQGVRLIRLRQNPLKKLSDWDIEYMRSDADLLVVQRLASAIAVLTANADAKKISDEYVEENRLLADDNYRKIIANLPSPPDGASFASIYPDVATEWHEERNAPLEPTMFAPKANRTVWWRCKKSGHEWQAAIHTRAVGIGCPYCSNQKIGSDNNLAHLRPDLLSEWNYGKNLSISPDNVAAKSNRKVWWKCVAAGHEWEARIGNRARGSGCPYCSGKATDPAHTLAALYPEIAATLDNDKNAPLSSTDLLANSKLKVWWVCRECGESWQCDVVHRLLAKVGCPNCFPAFRGEQMRLARLKSSGTLRKKAPDMAMRWHPTLNAEVSADDVGRHSTKSVWWLCPDCGHSWSISPHSYRRCPQCGSK